MRGKFGQPYERDELSRHTDRRMTSYDQVKIGCPFVYNSEHEVLEFFAIIRLWHDDSIVNLLRPFPLVNLLQHSVDNLRRRRGSLDDIIGRTELLRTENVLLLTQV